MHSDASSLATAFGREITGPLRVVIIAPPGYGFSETFREIAETVLYGLRELGHEATLAVNDFDPRATNILLGAHLLDERDADRLPDRIVVYNLEQVVGESQWIKPVYVALVRRHTTWDYSPRNIAQWRRFACANDIRHVPIGYAPELTRIAHPEDRDIDVLFYGTVNERRAGILRGLEEAGLRVSVLVGSFGAERDAAIARARVVLSMHFFRSQIFEAVRVSYLLANRKAVVAEVDEQTEVEPEFRDAVLTATYDQLVDACVELCYDDAAREKLEERGFERFRGRRESEILRQALAQPKAGAASDGEAVLPKIINLGSGRGWNLECLNIDVDPDWMPDVVWDFNRAFPPQHPVDLGRFGARAVPKGYFSEIRASHVLEHIRELATAMRSCLELLEVGGIMDIEVPYDLSHGAWQDPTHVRAMNERSWLYYTEWFWYLGWDEARFDVVDLKFLLSDHGERLQAQGRPLDELVREPRAVDAMRVVLRKRRLTPEEETRVHSRWRN